MDHLVEPVDLRPHGRVRGVYDDQLHGCGTAESHPTQTIWLARDCTDSQAWRTLGASGHRDRVISCKPAAPWTSSMTSLATSWRKTAGMMCVGSSWSAPACLTATAMFMTPAFRFRDGVPNPAHSAGSGYPGERRGPDRSSHGERISTRWPPWPDPSRASRAFGSHSTLRDRRPAGSARPRSPRPTTPGPSTAPPRSVERADRAWQQGPHPVLPRAHGTWAVSLSSCGLVVGVLLTHRPPRASTNRNRPPGRSSVRQQASAACGSGNVQRTQRSHPLRGAWVKPAGYPVTAGMTSESCRLHTP